MHDHGRKTLKRLNSANHIKFISLITYEINLRKMGTEMVIGLGHKYRLVFFSFKYFAWFLFLLILAWAFFFRNDENIARRTRRDDYTTVTITRPAKKVLLMFERLEEYLKKI